MIEFPKPRIFEDNWDLHFSTDKSEQSYFQNWSFVLKDKGNDDNSSDKDFD